MGNYLPSLAAARALAAEGYRVIAGDGGEYSTLRLSRSVTEMWPHPPVREADAFLAALRGFLDARTDIELVLPLQERYVELLGRERTRLPGSVTLVSPPSDVVATCLDKERMYAIAATAGVPHPRVRRADDMNALADALDDIGFPCVVRAARGGPWPGIGKVRICRQASDLGPVEGGWPPGHGPLIVQRHVEAPRHNVYFAARDGELLAGVETMIIRTDEPDGTGLAVEGVTMPPDARVIGPTRSLLGHLRYTGIGTAQFLVPARGDALFLELNPRHGAASVIADRSGLPLTALAVDLALERSEVPIASDFRYRPGRRYVWTSRDAYGLGRAVAAGRVGRRAAFRWATDLSLGAIRADVHVSWSLRDPCPTLAVYADLGRSALRHRR